MELLKGSVGHGIGYRLERIAPFIGYSGDGLSPYKRKWSADGLNHTQKYGKTFKREQGQYKGYDPLRLKELQRSNKRQKRNTFPKRRRRRMQVPRTVPRAPYNDSSFLMKVRRAGGLEALVSPATSSLLRTPDYSRAAYHSEGMVEPVAELGVGNGYGSMTGLIHLRASEDGLSSSSVDESDIDCMQEESSFSELDSVRRLEERLDRDVSRFELILPSPEDAENGAAESLEERVVRRERDIAFLEDENLMLKERLFLVQQEVNEYQKLLAARGSHGEVDELSAACSDLGSSH